MNILLVYLFLLSRLQMPAQNIYGNASITPVKVLWTGDLKGNFAFRLKWRYPEGVYRNKYGQLSCDGLCPEGTEPMKDANGRIEKDSLASFYRLVDTSHIYPSILSDARCYEFGEADEISVVRRGDSIICTTNGNASTHSCLCLSIVGDSCYASISLNSVEGKVDGSGPMIFPCKEGNIEIDRGALRKGVLKARFNFSFMSGMKAPGMYWRGEIYTRINATG